jgi:nicotinate-nucleotide--dimethylbenzimidazole phosphoribosyltransferase
MPIWVEWYADLDGFFLGKIWTGGGAEVLADTLKAIVPISELWLQKAEERLDNLTKPRKSLGHLEEMAARVAAIQEADRPSLDKREIFVFVGDHGVVAEGVSAYPQEVTALMVANFLAGGAAVNVLARGVGATVSVIDIGMKEPVPDAYSLVQRNVMRGTENIAQGPAMSRKEVEQAIEVGIEMAESAHARGATLIATGEMGIGNTTPSSALFAALLPAQVREVTDTGTGLDAQGLRNKIRVIEKALQVNHPNQKDPVSTLAAVGGLEIAGICGLCLGGAARRMVVVVDGFISSAGALVAMRLHPGVRDYLFFSHQSHERGHRTFFEQENLRPILDLDLRLGEGTGAALAMHLIHDSVRIYNEMATFEEVGIQPGE